eukprot:271574_1
MASENNNQKNKIIIKNNKYLQHINNNSYHKSPNKEWINSNSIQRSETNISVPGHNKAPYTHQKNNLQYQYAAINKYNQMKQQENAQQQYYDQNNNLINDDLKQNHKEINNIQQ